MLDADLAFAGVARQAEMVRRGEVSSCELVEVALARIERFDPHLNCFGVVRAERAYADAEAADHRRRRGEDAPLLGVPLAVKDEMYIAGEVTSRGTGAFVTPAAADSRGPAIARPRVVDGDLGLKLVDTAVIVGLLFAGIRDLIAEVERPERLERRTRALARPGRLVPEPIRTRLRARERALAARLAPLFTDHDALLMPVVSRPAEPAQAMEGRGATLTYLWETGWVPFTVLWNAVGQPAASVPAGFSRDGLPLAVQLVGRPDDETTLLSLSAQLESLRPWADHRPPVGT